jgi:DNA-binding response OmpR family regulator
MTVLYVDDEPTIRRAVQLWLSRYGIHVVTAASIAEARDRLETHHVDGVFLDVWLEDGSGFDLYDWLRTAHPMLAERVAFVTGDVLESSRTHVRLGRLGCPVLRKPFNLEALKDIVAQWVRSAGRDRVVGHDANPGAHPAAQPESHS